MISQMIVFRKLVKDDRKSFREINRLLLQLSSSAKRLSYGNFQKIVRDKSNLFSVLCDEKKIIGMGLVVFIHTPRGLRARLEDVVIDEDYRRKGFGSTLVRQLIGEAQKRKALWVELTSRKDRVETKKFYQKLGFRPRNTNVYRLSF